MATSANVKTRVLKLTPSRAQGFLDSMVANRKLSDRRVEMLADALSRGEYVFNGDPLKFNSQGRMVDGQHRCAAVIKSGVSIPILIVENLKPSAIETIDGGKPRSMSDRLQMKGYIYTNEIASLALLLWKYRNGLVTGTRKTTPTAHQLFEFIKKDPQIAVSAKFSSNYNLPFLTKRFVAFLHHRIHAIDKSVWPEFWEALSEGTGLDENDPLLVLRNLLLRAKLSRVRHLSPTVTWAFCIKAWNAWYNQEEVANYTFRLRGSRKESFPVMDGDENYILTPPSKE